MAAAGDPVRWGVVGCAGIAAKTCTGIAEASNATVAAVASRSLEKAQAFIADHAPGAAPYDAYEKLLADESVKVVYVPLPTMLRKEWVKKAAAAGKHVLCEKPIAVSNEDAEEVVEACRTAGVQFMDNTMFMHHARQGELRKEIDKPEFGKVKHVVSCFTIPFGNDEEWAKSNIRMDASTEPLGCLGDLGWYNIRLSLWAFNWEWPEDVSCQYLETTPDGVPLTVHGILRYSGGRSATFDCSFKCSLRQWAEVVGEKRTVSWDDMCVTQIKDQSDFTVGEASIADKAITFPKDLRDIRTVGGCVQHTKLIETMSEIVSSGTLDDSWGKMSLQTQKVLLACHQSGGSKGEWVKL